MFGVRVVDPGARDDVGLRELLREACTTVRLPCDDAVLLRIGENALYHLVGAGVVVRIGRSLHYLLDVRKELAVAAWLHNEAFPGTQALDDFSQPIVVGDRPVTFWRYIKSGAVAPTFGDLGLLLRRLHELRAPDLTELPNANPFVRVQKRLAMAPISVPPETKSFLHDRHVDLARKYKKLRFVLPSGPIHGDAHTGNLLAGTDGVVRLIDYEAFSTGPREWDLVATANAHSNFTRVDDDDYRDFCDAYGFDVTTWPGFPVLRAVRELTMTTWLMQNIDTSSDVADEFSMRVADLHDEAAPRRWHAM